IHGVLSKSNQEDNEALPFCSAAPGCASLCPVTASRVTRRVDVTAIHLFGRVSAGARAADHVGFERHVVGGASQATAGPLWSGRCRQRGTRRPDAMTGTNDGRAFSALTSRLVVPTSFPAHALPAPGIELTHATSYPKEVPGVSCEKLGFSRFNPRLIMTSLDSLDYLLHDHEAQGDEVLPGSKTSHSTVLEIF
ncbi:hypothetical protein EJB05_12003, partial [Eragrostis curvula]